MSAWQRFKLFPKATRVWSWILAAAAAYFLVNTIYLNTESPYSYINVDGVTLTGLNAAQMNNICQSPAGHAMQIAHPSSATTCNNAQSIEQQKAISAWLLVLLLAALVTLLVVSWNKTRPAATGAAQRGPVAPGPAPVGWPPPPGSAFPPGWSPPVSPPPPGSAPAAGWPPPSGSAPPQSSAPPAGWPQSSGSSPPHGWRPPPSQTAEPDSASQSGWTPPPR
jgi:hypothetical protein